jgi:hypothetical protein
VVCAVVAGGVAFFRSIIVRVKNDGFSKKGLDFFFVSCTIHSSKQHRPGGFRDSQEESEMEKKGEYLVREEYRVVFFDGVEYFDIDGPFASAEEAEEALQRANEEWAQSHPDE